MTPTPPQLCLRSTFWFNPSTLSFVEKLRPFLPGGRLQVVSFREVFACFPSRRRSVSLCRGLSASTLTVCRVPHAEPPGAESDGPAQVASAPSGCRLAASGPLRGAAAEGPSGLRCGPRWSILQPSSLRPGGTRPPGGAPLGPAAAAMLRWGADGVLGPQDGPACQDPWGTAEPYRWQLPGRSHVQEAQSSPAASTAASGEELAERAVTAHGDSKHGDAPGAPRGGGRSVIAHVRHQVSGVCSLSLFREHSLPANSPRWNCRSFPSLQSALRREHPAFRCGQYAPVF